MAPVNRPPAEKSANEFVERELHDRARKVAEAFGTDFLSFNGPLYGGVDDLFRSL